MDRTLSPRIGLVLGLLLGFPALEAALLPAPAYAQAKDERGERRVLKANEVDARTAQSAELRQKAHDARLDSISRLKEIISNTTASGDQKAEMLLRLADLYFEEGRELYLNEMDGYEKKYDQCFNAPPCDTATIKQADYVKESRGWQDKSIKLYKQILASYPQYIRSDEATFYLGQALLDTGNPEPANAEFTRLVKTYPESRYVPDAYVQIGEFWFDQNSAYKALTAYQKAAAFKDHEKYAFASYKLAWCYYNVGDYPRSIETMKAVVSFSMNQETTLGPDGKPIKRNIQLMDEALKDLVRFFADAGEMDEAYDYFNKLGKKELIRDMLKRLASTYYEQGKFEQAIQTYRRLIAEDPQGASAPDFQNEIIQALAKMGKKEDTLAEIDRLLKNYGKQSSWARSNAANQDAVKSAEEFIEKGLRTVAINYHGEAKRLKTGAQATQTYALAERAYEVYLQEFPDSKYSYEVRYSYSELLYTVKKYDSAYVQYMKVVSIDPKGQHSRFCAESAIFAAEKVLEKESKAAGGPGPDPGKKTDSVPLSEWETKELTALDQFAKLFPQDDKVRNIIYKSAYLLYNKNHFKDASERFNVVIAMDPKSKEAEQAANLILDSFALVEDWDSLKRNSKFYYDQAGLGSEGFKREVYGIYENASLKFIEIDFKKSQDKKVGAANYWTFYQEFPSSANADLALKNASVYLHDLGDTSGAMKVRHEIIGKFPKSKYYKDQVASLGFDYESIANFGESANWYEKLYTLDKTHSGSADAIFSAALFRNSLGQWEQAIKNYQQYILTYPDKPNLTGIQLDIGRIYEEHQKWPEAAGVYLKFFSASTVRPVKNAPAAPPPGSLDEIMYARLHYGLLMDKLGQGAKVGQHWKDTLAFFDSQKKLGSTFELSVEYVAQIMFILADPEYQAYMALKISGPGDKKMPEKQVNKILTDQLVTKVKAMGAVEKTYTAIIGTGAGEWGLASLARLGAAYENLSESLKGSWIPTYLTDDQKEIYVMTLEDKAYPQIEKAAAAYSAALGRSYDLNLYNDNTANATRRLGVLRPEEFPGLFEKIPEPRYSSPSTFTGTFETEP